MLLSFITQTDIFQMFICFSLDGYNWQLLKTPKFRILENQNIVKMFTIENTV